MTLNGPIRSLVFDFGGTLDSNGIHSRFLFFRAFQKYAGLKAEDLPFFQEAYSYSDQKVISDGLIQASHLGEMNQVMCSFIFEFLNKKMISEVDREITRLQSTYLKYNKPILMKLSTDYELGIISNFSGNLAVILKEFELDHLFRFVLDSFYVGATKPQLAIFQKAIEASSFRPIETLYIGDNEDRDILPAKKMEFQTVLMIDKHREDYDCFRRKSESSSQISSLDELVVLLEKIQSR